MSLLRCFKVSSDTTKLPDPRGPLSTTVPSSSIESANSRSEASDRNRRVLINEKEATMRSFLLTSDRKTRCREWSLLCYEVHSEGKYRTNLEERLHPSF